MSSLTLTNSNRQQKINYEHDTLIHNRPIEKGKQIWYFLYLFTVFQYNFKVVMDMDIIS